MGDPVAPWSMHSSVDGVLHLQVMEEAMRLFRALFSTCYNKVTVGPRRRIDGLGVRLSFGREQLTVSAGSVHLSPPTSHLVECL